MQKFPGASFIADDVCRYLVRGTSSMRVVNVGRMSWSGVGDVSSEGRSKFVRDGYEV